MLPAEAPANTQRARSAGNARELISSGIAGPTPTIEAAARHNNFALPWPGVHRRSAWHTADRGRSWGFAAIGDDISTSSAAPTKPTGKPDQRGFRRAGVLLSTELEQRGGALRSPPRASGARAIAGATAERVCQFVASMTRPLREVQITPVGGERRSHMARPSACGIATPAANAARPAAPAKHRSMSHVDHTANVDA